DPGMAHAVEALSAAAALPWSREFAEPARRAQFANPWAFARTCYDHLAGWLGVELAHALQRREYLRANDDGAYELAPRGKTFFAEIGIDCEQQLQLRRA